MLPQVESPVSLIGIDLRAVDKDCSAIALRSGLERNSRSVRWEGANHATP
jgi:hypothetical protein